MQAKGKVKSHTAQILSHRSLSVPWLKTEVSELRHRSLVSKLRYKNLVSELRHRSLVSKLRHRSLVSEWRHRSLVTSQDDGCSVPSIVYTCDSSRRKGKRNLLLS